MTRHRIGCAAVVFALVLEGCGSAPVDGTAPPAAGDDPVSSGSLPAPSAFELKQRNRAVALGKQDRPADAAIAWEILTVLRPDVAEYRDRLSESRARIEASATEHMARAAQAEKRGDADAAVPQYLAVISLQPDNARAADRLRAIERERVRRNQLGKYSRITLTRRAVSEAEIQSAAAPSTTAAESGELEHASLLASQGEYEDAIGLLERRLAKQKRDAAASQLLADIYFQKAQSLSATDRPAAVKALQRAVRLDPSNARVASRLRELNSSAPATASAAASANRR